MAFNTTPFTVTNETYIGNGALLLRKRGSAAPFRAVGNSAKVSFGLKEATVKDKNYLGGGGDNDTYSHFDEASISIETSNMSSANIGLATRSDVDAYAAGTVTGESITLYQGGLMPTAFIGASNVMLTDQGGQPITGGFEARSSGIYVPAGSAISDGTTVTAAYSYPEQDFIEAMTSTGDEWEAIFEGMNAAKGGAPVVIFCHRLKFAPTSGIDLISNEFGKLPLAGTLLADNAQPPGKSRFFVTKRVPVA